MYFKTFPVLLISYCCIIDYALGDPSEDKILEKSFDDCRKWLKKPSEPTISLFEFFSYVGNYRQTVNSAKLYLKEKEIDAAKQNEIDLGLYKELIQAICNVNGLPLAFFAEIRRDASNYESTLSGPLMLVPEPTEDEVLEKSFDDCRKWLKKPSEPTISLFEFFSYVGNYRQTVNSAKLYLKEKEIDAAKQNEIDLGLYKYLIQAICKDNGLPTTTFVKIRKEAPKVMKGN